MDKIKLNNQIVLMRKYVKQAKVHVINKLAKEVKLLQNRKGSEAQVQKAKRKAERFLEEIILLKKTKPDDVSKLALSKAKDWKDVLKQKNSTLHDRCIAMLANYGAVAKQVEIFYNDNKALVVKIMDLINQWEEKNKNFPKAKKVSGANKIKLEPKPSLKNKNLSSDKQISLNAVGKTNLPSSKKIKELEENELSNINQKLIINNEKKTTDKLNEMLADDTPKTVQSNKDSGNEDKGIVLEMKTFHSEECMDNVAVTSDADLEGKIVAVNKPSIDKDLSRTVAKKLQSDENGMDAEESENGMDAEESENSMDAEESENSMDAQSENSMDAEESESDNEEKLMNNNSAATVEVENEKNELKKTDKVQKYDVSEFIKKNLEKASSSERKLKAIALLNLDEMQELKEIPIGNKNESSESDVEETSENETHNVSHNKKNDPFFLGCGSNDLTFEKSDNLSEDRDFSSRNKDPFFTSTKTQREAGNFSQKRESSNHDLNHRRKYQNTGYLKKDFKRFGNDDSRSQSPKKGKFLAKNPGKYQEKWKSNFNKDNLRNKKDFKMYPRKTNEKTFESNSKGWNSKNTENTTTKNKVPHRKDNTSNQPLHPSWEAKKKQKEMINTSFQGKRMVFDD